MGTGQGDTVEVVYYADLLREQGRQSGDGDSLDDLTESESDMLLRILQAQPVAAAGNTAAIPQGRLTALLRSQLADIAESWACDERLMEWFMVRFVKEVSAYQAPGPAREGVQQRLCAALDRHRPDVLIAHSLGSVVAYETLHLLRDDAPPVPLWVTLGSPLALPKAVFDRLTPAPVVGLGARPPAVGHWANLADAGDLVAIPAKGVSRRFSGVNTDGTCSIHAFDFHKVTNYLKTRELARILTTI
ncbi:hypothetical protein ACH437_15340 [Streptomyces xinghaiensis]|uniref:hypothetical protein n=1 Tax=Streptomyces xinghaiensis TaxID=1038928 RepID=UPI00379A2492